ncbi:SLBB domain-containing protein [Solimonas flava]|uniref:SLBB domain-containing protein n=1 Tax=Solimonas flava TaxID=415849 RepID=UPI00040D51FA|nr:SLBB domain-containing protein [Solimonas flava]
MRTIHRVASVMRRHSGAGLAVVAIAVLAACAGPAERPVAAAAPPPAAKLLAAIGTEPELLQLGPGDAVRLQIVGRPELSTTLYVSDGGELDVPMIGRVKAAGLSPAEAARNIAGVFRSRELLVDPQVTLVLDRYQSQRISVLGEVRSPGRLALESRTTVFDALAQAGGTTEDAGDVVYVMRTGADGAVSRVPVPLRVGNAAASAPMEIALRGGDAIYVPPAERFYIYGEVNAANMYRLEPGMTVLQAISRGGGLTVRGSGSRIEISRRAADGHLARIDAAPADRVLPGDVIRVKERLF